MLILTANFPLCGPQPPSVLSRSLPRSHLSHREAGVFERAPCFLSLQSWCGSQEGRLAVVVSLIQVCALPASSLCLQVSLALLLGWLMFEALRRGSEGVRGAECLAFVFSLVIFVCPD